MTTKGYEVFISASPLDQAYAEPVFHELSKRNIKVFYSPISLPKLDDVDFLAAIEDAIDKSENIVVVASTMESFASKWVQKETGLFLIEEISGRKQGNLITLLVGEKMRIEDLPIRFRTSQVIPYNPDDGFNQLYRFVEKPIETPPRLRDRY